MFQWPRDNEVYPAFDTIMGQLLHALQHEEILSARNAPKGTQLKLLLQLAGKQKVIFKPKWYERNTVIDGPIYAGKDRHFAEIIAFYLGALLNLRWTPIAVGRKINLKEIYHEKADKLLRSTMLVNGMSNVRELDDPDILFIVDKFYKLKVLLKFQMNKPNTVSMVNASTAKKQMQCAVMMIIWSKVLYCI